MPLPPHAHAPRRRGRDARASPWFFVEKNDIFPEQFPTFLVPPGKPRDVFMAVHGDLADAGYWIAQQERVKAGIQDDLFPYDQAMRFSKRYS